MTPVNRPSIIDVEASGFGPHSYPIEIGLVLTSGERYCSLILPHPEWTYWDKEAEKVHGITRNQLKSHGKSIAAVATRLNALLKNLTVYSDGWVVDNPWVIRLFYTAAVSQRFTVSPLEILLTEAQMEIWHATKSQIIQELQVDRHRASTDALIVQETYFRTRIQKG